MRNCFAGRSAANLFERAARRAVHHHFSFLIPNLIFRFIIVSHFFREVKPCLM